MSYLDITITSVYPDRIPIEREGRIEHMDGLWHFDVVVTGTDMTVEEAKSALTDNVVFRAITREGEPEDSPTGEGGQS
jgi:hypothetical protein